MAIAIMTRACSKGQIAPLIRSDSPAAPAWPQAHQAIGSPPVLRVGEKLILNAKPIFMVTGRAWLPSPNVAINAPILMALEDIHGEDIVCQVSRQGYSLAAITMSDKGSQGLRVDKSGPLIVETLKKNLPISHSQNFILPDNATELRGLLADLALCQGYNMIITSGGTGLGPRDITPQTTETLLDLPLPGFCQAMLAASLAKTPRAIISRAAAGVIDKCLVVNLPGSAKAVAENLEAILPALDHALAKLNGDPSDCGG